MESEIVPTRVGQESPGYTPAAVPGRSPAPLGATCWPKGRNQKSAFTQCRDYNTVDKESAVTRTDGCWAATVAEDCRTAFISNRKSLFQENAEGGKKVNAYVARKLAEFAASILILVPCVLLLAWETALPNATFLWAVLLACSGVFLAAVVDQHCAETDHPLVEVRQQLQEIRPLLTVPQNAGLVVIEPVVLRQSGRVSRPQLAECGVHEAPPGGGPLPDQIQVVRAEEYGVVYLTQGGAVFGRHLVHPHLPPPVPVQLHPPRGCC